MPVKSPPPAEQSNRNSCTFTSRNYGCRLIAKQAKKKLIVIVILVEQSVKNVLFTLVTQLSHFYYDKEREKVSDKINERMNKWIKKKRSENKENENNERKEIESEKERERWQLLYLVVVMVVVLAVKTWNQPEERKSEERKKELLLDTTLIFFLSICFSIFISALVSFTTTTNNTPLPLSLFIKIIIKLSLSLILSVDCRYRVTVFCSPLVCGVCTSELNLNCP